MKKIIMAIAATLMVSSAAMAQDSKQEQGQRKRPDKTEMVKHRTDDMVKKYGLNDAQAKKLLALNTKYADKMAPRGGRPHGRPGMGPGPEGGQKPESGQKPEGKRPELTAEQKARMEADRKAHMETMKAYEAELQTILTADQFKSYQEDMKKGGPRGGRGGQRPPKDKK